MTLLRKKAVVAGGSLAGLFTGVFLQRNGWDVSIHERVGEDLGARGAGIVTHDDLQHKLRLATGLTEPFGLPVEGRVVLGRGGEVICESVDPQRLASWDRLWHALRLAAGDLYRAGSALVSFETVNDRIVAQFSDASDVHADLLVCADGIRSTGRALLLPDVSPRYAGYIAWRGLVPESKLSAATREQLLSRFGFCLPSGEQMLGYPVHGTSDDEKRYNYVWYRPADEARDFPKLFTGSDGKFYGNAIPPALISPETLAEMRQAADMTLAPAFAEIVRSTEQPLLQAIFDLEVPKMVIGRAVIIGDAAFVARPHPGMGVTKAAADAYALAEQLATTDDIDAALSAFEVDRLAYGQRIVRRARHLGAYMQSQLSSAEERKRAELHRSPQAVMQETATMRGFDAW